MKRNTFNIFLHFLQRLAERIENNIYSTSKKLFFRNFRGEDFRIFLRYVSFIAVQHEIEVIRTARTVDCKSDKSACMTLLQFLKHEKRGATKKFNHGNTSGNVGQRFMEYLRYEKEQENLRKEPLP